MKHRVRAFLGCPSFMVCNPVEIVNHDIQNFCRQWEGPGFQRHKFRGPQTFREVELAVNEYIDEIREKELSDDTDDDDGDLQDEYFQTHNWPQGLEKVSCKEGRLVKHAYHERGGPEYLEKLFKGDEVYEEVKRRCSETTEPFTISYQGKDIECKNIPLNLTEVTDEEAAAPYAARGRYMPPVQYSFLNSLRKAQLIELARAVDVHSQGLTVVQLKEAIKAKYVELDTGVERPPGYYPPGVKEVLDQMQDEQEHREQGTRTPGRRAAARPVRSCAICSSTGHNASTCPQRNSLGGVFGGSSDDSEISDSGGDSGDEDELADPAIAVRCYDFRSSSEDK